ncbi:lamin tail domain-containing protein [Streptomyces sp. NPDC004232]|uniref:lamin tail domain-containing protein n=1 Tax=Streptomyces sp. NPDC004232 TaxID=3154454 RepID=UPI0033A68103
MSASSSVRRVTVVGAIAAAAVGAVALPAAAAQKPARTAHAAVYISKVQYDSPGRDDRSNRSLNAEWVDIANSTRRAVNLDHWTLRDDAGHTYTFRHVSLAPRATVRVHTGIGRDTRSDLYQDKRNYVWNNNGDTATLRNDRGRTVDTASWGRDRGHRH